MVFKPSEYLTSDLSRIEIIRSLGVRCENNVKRYSTHACAFSFHPSPFLINPYPHLADGKNYAINCQE